MAKLRLAVITDVHYGFDHKNKLGSKAPRLMEHFTKAVNLFAPDAVVDLGDRISARNAESDREYMKQYRAHFNKIAAPLETVTGNHDIINLSRHENEEIMRSPSGSYSKDIGGFHLVFWSPVINYTKTGLELLREDMDWLKDDLEKAKDKKAFIFTHVPLDNEKGEELAPVTKYFYWTQGKQVRKIFEDVGNVVLCMCGHLHNDRVRVISGIPYVTQQAFTSEWKEKYRVPSRTYSFLEADDEGVRISRRGKSRKDYDFQFQTGGLNRQ